MIFEKLKPWIERIPWYLFAFVIPYFLFQIYLNAENLVLVAINVVGAACFAYVTAHNLMHQHSTNNNK
jgi:hypothetical protein